MGVITLVFVAALGCAIGAGVRLARISMNMLTFLLYPAGFVMVLRAFGSGDADRNATVSADMAGVDLFSLTNIIVFLAMLGFGVFLIDRPEAFSRLKFSGWNPLAGFRKSAAQLDELASAARNQRRRRANKGMTVYYEAVLKFGAHIADADDAPNTKEFRALCTAFGIDESRVPGAREIYRSQLKTKESLRIVLGPLKAAYAPRSGPMETFVFGMCQVASADGVIHGREVTLIRLAAEMLGFSALDIARILGMAGVLDDGPQRHQHTGGQQRSQTEKTATADRTRHLSVLGLKAGASAAEIKKSYRKLARKYHPDVLRSQGLAASELARASAMMVKLNAAYEALQKN
jgi:DnaJ like chaperone protein